jgi:Skp family chaperone for outer membrane proteins
MEAIRRRQEKELSKIIAKEQAMVALQQKLQRAEEEEVKRKKEHEKKVKELKLIAEKKQTQRLHDIAQKVSQICPWTYVS